MIEFKNVSKIYKTKKGVETKALNNINLKIIEPDEARCEKLCEIVKDGVMIIQGDGHDMGLLYIYQTSLLEP